MEEYYKVLHLLQYTLKYDIQAIQNMMPWEIEVELGMVQESIAKELAKRQQVDM